METNKTKNTLSKEGINMSEVECFELLSPSNLKEGIELNKTYSSKTLDNMYDDKNFMADINKADSKVITNKKNNKETLDNFIPLSKMNNKKIKLCNLKEIYLENLKSTQSFDINVKSFVVNVKNQQKDFKNKTNRDLL